MGQIWRFRGGRVCETPGLALAAPPRTAKNPHARNFFAGPQRICGYGSWDAFDRGKCPNFAIPSGAPQPPICHPERSGPQGRGVEGSPPRGTTEISCAARAARDGAIFVHHGKYAAPGRRIVVSCWYMAMVYGRSLRIAYGVRKSARRTTGFSYIMAIYQHETAFFFLCATYSGRCTTWLGHFRLGKVSQQQRSSPRSVFTDAARAHRR